MQAISYSYFLQILGWALLNSLWQMALLWVIYRIFIFSSAKLTTERKTNLAILLLLAGFGWFIFTFISSLFIERSSTFYSGWATLLHQNGWNVFVDKIITICSLFYLFILIIQVWKFISNYNNAQIIRKNGLKKIAVEWKIFVAKTAANMGIVRKVQIWLSDIVKTPVTIGYLKPIILIPIAAINHLSTHQVEAIILHELEHIRRYDYLFNLLINFIKTILYFNPFVKLFVKSIERDREMNCDEMVVRYQYRPAEYASALLLLQKSKHQLMMMSAAGKDHDLLHRIEAILGIGNKRNFSIRQFVLPIVTLFLFGLMNVFFSVNANKEINRYFSFTQNINPYYFLNGQSNNSKNNTVSDFINSSSVSSEKNYSANNLNKFSVFKDAALENIPESPFSFATSTTDIIPELPDSNEMKLKETVVATKKILQEQQWSDIEKGYAEVYNSYEKEILKKEYQKEVEKIDWNKLEDKLRLYYENINWDKVNEQVKSSLATMKLDSLEHEVTLAISNLDQIEILLKNNNTTSIPDTDISLEKIEDNQKKMKSQLDKIKALKSRKIIRL